MEAPEAGTTAENVAAYFAKSATQASAHWCVDNNSRVRCVYDDNSAWAMPPANEYSLNVEMAGYAAQTAVQWDDAYSLAMMKIAALCVAEWCVKYDIPVRHLTTAQIKAREKGIAGHVDVNRAFHASDHTDPGPHFPWVHFLIEVKAQVQDLSAKMKAPHIVEKDCKSLQKSVRVTADGKWGSDTDRHCDALIAATAFGHYKFPSGIKFAQQVVGVKQDGVWGPTSKSAMRDTVKAVQRDLETMGFAPGVVDGIWGATTNKAYQAARTACHV
jgi:hypothetical protein